MLKLYCVNFVNGNELIVDLKAKGNSINQTRQNSTN